ncbi:MULTISPECIES: hypothetical protein [Paenibacillus]|uniref:Nucleotide-diphospho-sugar transferase domain-containing protein n=1 Tax=Paenibacillus violae TaxID=3077234 RepID=A0ABU3RH32_9BACL|nr:MULTISPECIES: hypothetical protein [Paenibacillus]MDU0203595.1 hypothetical protein [Paenibacillus sp. PFR10]MEC0267529.1 hypothetical protein [Paenibacillus anseongense]
MDMTPTHINELIQKKLVIIVIAHENEQVLAAQVENIHFFNPEAGIILYNGGPNPDFGKNVNIWSFPHSHPLKAGIIAPGMWEIMKWLEEIGAGYEYLMSLDHDVLFVKHGFQPFLDEVMAESDSMGWRLENNRDHDFSLPVQNMMNEWHLWQPVFRTDGFLTYFNPGQVYRHDIVRRMLAHVDHAAVDHLFGITEAAALEEVFFVTLAMACGGRVREYPEGAKYNDMVRWGENITYESVQQHRDHPYYYWIHPIKGDKLLEMNQLLLPKPEPIASALPAPRPAVLRRKRIRRKRLLKRALPRRRIKRRKFKFGLRSRKRTIKKLAKKPLRPQSATKKKAAKTKKRTKLG